MAGGRRDIHSANGMSDGVVTTHHIIDRSVNKL